MAKIDTTPLAGGAFRTPEMYLHPLKGLEWGLCHKDEGSSVWNYILRFDIELRYRVNIAMRERFRAEPEAEGISGYNKSQKE